MLRDRCVEHAQRVRKANLFENFEAVVFPERHRCADKIAEAIQGADSGFLKWRNEEGASQVCRVVLDIVNLRQLVHGDRERIRQRSLQSLKLLKIAEPVSNQSTRGAAAEDEGRLS